MAMSITVSSALGEPEAVIILLLVTYGTREMASFGFRLRITLPFVPEFVMIGRRVVFNGVPFIAIATQSPLVAVDELFTKKLI